MRKHLLGCAFLLATLLATVASATAADLARAPVYTKARPAVAPAFGWSGFYVGINGGYGWGEDSVNLSGPPGSFFAFGAANGVFPTSLASSPQGGVAGGQIGWNYQTGAVVLGLEADIDWTDIKDSGASVTALNNITGIPRTVTASQSLDWLATFRGRLGFTPADRWLVYVTGGGAGGHANVSAGLATNDFAGPGSGCVAGTCEAASNSQTLWGWSAGVGAEAALDQHWSFRAEYLHYDLGSISVNAIDARFLPVGSNATIGTANVRGDIVRGAVNFRFY